MLGNNWFQFVFTCLMTVSAHQAGFNEVDYSRIMFILEMSVVQEGFGCEFDIILQFDFVWSL